MVRYQGHFETKELDPFTLEKAYEALKFEHEGQSVGYYDVAESSLLLCGEVTSSLLKNSVYIDTIAVVGIGGSSLGIKAIDRLLRPKTPHAKKILYFENSDPISIAAEASKVEFAKTLFIVISKSGGTVETLSIFKYLISKFNITLENSPQVIIISDEKSVLSQFAKNYNLKSFVIPSNVGGRFSVLSAVGTVPLMLAGFNFREVLYGARSFGERFWERKEEHLLRKAAFYVVNAKKTPINVLFSYSDTFEEF
ncbi:MAG: glucose-6-phosphate isomerase, partial [Sulfuricurvum sp.]